MSDLLRITQLLSSRPGLESQDAPALIPWTLFPNTSGIASSTLLSSFLSAGKFPSKKICLIFCLIKMSKFILKLLQPWEKIWPLSFSEENCNRDFCECGLWVCLYAKSLQSCLTLWGPVDYSLPGSLEFSRQEYWPGCHAPLQRIFMTQRLNLHLSHLLYW